MTESPSTRYPSDWDADSDVELQPPSAFEQPKSKTKKTPPSSEDSELHEELLSLAERGEIKHTVNHIKKASNAALEKIMLKYKQDQTEAVKEYFTNTLIGKFPDLMDQTGMVENGDNMGKELVDSELLKKDLKSIVSHVTPYIPYIGLLTGGILVANYLIG